MDINRVIAAAHKVGAVVQYGLCAGGAKHPGRARPSTRCGLTWRAEPQGRIAAPRHADSATRWRHVSAKIVDNLSRRNDVTTGVVLSGDSAAARESVAAGCLPASQLDTYGDRAARGLGPGSDLGRAWAGWAGAPTGLLLRRRWHTARTRTQARSMNAPPAGLLYEEVGI